MSVKHGFRRKSQTHPLYIKWEHMHQRCRDKNHTSYANYGGRGIKVCDEWKTFQGFLGWDKLVDWKSGLQIDRIDTNGDYHPENCRWATIQENSQNRTTTVLSPFAVRAIRRMYETGQITQREIGEIMECSQALVSNVVRGLMWSNVGT
jgi:hypothetical protein